jgi:hypothetical protein
MYAYRLAHTYDKYDVIISLSFLKFYAFKQCLISAHYTAGVITSVFRKYMSEEVTCKCMVLMCKSSRNL